MNWGLITTAFQRAPDTDDARQALAITDEPMQEKVAPLAPAHQDTIFIARQPIFDATEKICAYQLLIRPSGSLPEAPPLSANESARLIVNTLNTLGAHTVLGSHSGLISLPAGALHSDIVSLLPCSSFILETPHDFKHTPENEARCAQLQKQGYQLAHTCTGSASELNPITRAANYVIYDLALDDIQQIAKRDRTVKPLGITRLVRNVNTRVAFEACKPFGFDLYQGSFFAKVETLASKRVDPTQSRVIEIFNLVMNKADIEVIEDAFKHDVALCYSLLCYINSVGSGLQYKVSSMRNAIMLLGYDFLWRWLSLLVYAGIDLSAAQRVLLNTAIIRGRLTELLGKINLPEKESNALFVVGNFSLLDALLGIPMTQALQRVHLPEAISAAILKHEGKYAPYLDLALAFETNQAGEADRLCKQLHIDPTRATQAHLEAIAWANVVAK